MASEIVGEMRTGTASLRDSGNNGLSFESTAEFLVVASDKYVSKEEVLLLTPGLPIVGLMYGPLGATCTSKDAERHKDHASYWIVKCSFETGRERQKQNPNNPSPDPKTWIPVFRIDSFIVKEKVVAEDKTPASAGNVNFGTTGPYKCRNSARQPFEEPFTEKKLLCQFSFEQFEDPSQDINDIIDRNDSVNSATFAGRDARTLLINVTGAELGFYGGYGAWRVVYQVTYDPDTHDEFRLDVGTCYLDSGNQKPYMDALEQYRITGNLNGTGGKSTGDPAILKFRVKKELDFSTFIRTA